MLTDDNPIGRCRRGVVFLSGYNSRPSNSSSSSFGIVVVLESPGDMQMTVEKGGREISALEIGC
jgi:hypothetical protein